MKKILFILTLFFLSCSQDELRNEETDSSIVQNEAQMNEKFLIDKSIVDLSSEDAKNVALIFRSKSSLKTTSTRAISNLEKGDLNIQTIFDTITNKPILYIANWNHNKGYVIISATKKSNPILAFSETGHFDPKIDLGSKTYIEKYKSQIINSYKETSDSLQTKYSVEWSSFEKAQLVKVSNQKTRTMGKDINVLMQEEIKKKEALGYTYIGKLSILPTYLPLEMAQMVQKDICMHTDPRYNCEDVSLFFIESYNFEQVGPLINTKWHQGYPFNVDAPNGFAGCVPIAVAQIAYYHKYPTKYNWGQISLNPSLNSSFKNFIIDIRDLCQVEYEDNGTSSTFKKALSAFRELGYEATDGGLPGSINLRTELKFKKPVYISGRNEERDTGHAWLCEGYLNKKYRAVISMILRPIDDSSPYFDYPLEVNQIGPADEVNGEFYYMNFGWGGVNDGWYRANSYRPSDLEHCYLDDQKMITIKK